MRREGLTLIPLLRRQAPTWLVQIPASMEEAEREALAGNYSVRPKSGWRGSWPGRSRR